MSDENRPRIAVVDYGAGNLRSVFRALQLGGADAAITDRASDIRTADAIVLPGDGAAVSAMRGLGERALIGPLRDAIGAGRPFFGVCLGLQVLMSWSDEDDGTECLGIIPGRVVRLPEPLKVPHIGWNQVERRAEHPLLNDIPNGDEFYFLHSYVAVPDDPSAIVGSTTYGVPFASILRNGNVIATQFHPEKSAQAGLQIYRNFTRWVDESRLGVARAIGELI